MSIVIQTRQLTKRYGQRLAVNDLSLEVEQGAIYGFVGPNGAGKTTTMRILTTLLRPTSGQAWVAGCAVDKDPRGARRAIGYMPDFFGVYDDLTVWEYLDFFAACYEIPAAARPGIIANLLELVDLTHRRADPVDKLSRGMKQRLCLARTLAHDPQVLILDEPASGLDPRARVEIRELLVELSRLGKTIFFSTHILADVAEICTQVGIVENGRLVAQGALAEIRRRHWPHRRLTITFLERAAEAQPAVQGMEGVLAIRALDGQTLEVDFAGADAAVAALLRQLVNQGWPVIRFNENLQDLEEVFLHTTQGNIG